MEAPLKRAQKSDRLNVKGQASLEQLFVIGIALAFVAIAFYIASAYSSDSMKISQSEDAVQRIAAAVDYVYSLGPNSKEYVTVYMPQDLRSANVTGRRVVFTVGTSAGTTDIFANTRADLVGALPQTGGKQRILVEYLSSGKIRVGEAGIACAPSMIIRNFNASQSDSSTINITNAYDTNVTGINATFTGAAALLGALSQPSSVLAPGAATSARISWSVPSNVASGIYGGLVEVGSENGGTCTTQTTVYISGTSSCSALCAAQGYSSGTCRASPAACVGNSEDYVSGNDYACGNVSSPSCCCYPSADAWGPSAQNLTSTPINASATQNITIWARCNDTSTGGSYIKSADLQVDGGAWSSMSANDGGFSSSVIEAVNGFAGTLLPGQHIAAVRCTDTANNTGASSYIYLNISMADVIGPIITQMNHTEYPTTLTNLSENGIATEIYTGNANVVSCDIKLDSGAWQAAYASDGSFNSPTEAFYRNFGTLASGTHTIYARCTDALGNVGGTYNDTFGVTSVDVMLVIDKSGSMAEPVTNAYDNTAVSTTSASFALVKSVSVTVKNGNAANVSTEIRAGSSGCTASFEARVGSTVIASGNRTSTSYGTITLSNADIAAYAVPFTVDLYMKRSAAGCTAYNRNFNITQTPSKMTASQVAANTFVDIVGNSTKAGMVSYSTTASTDRQLAMMDTVANRNTLKGSINGLSPSGNTCIECGLDNGVTELISARSRYPDATRVIILLTDGQGNVGDSVSGAVYARDNNVVVYTIGFGDSVDETELTNIALLTHGQYYFAPDAATLLYIYQHIGQ